jgi:hypothetical protein
MEETNIVEGAILAFTTDEIEDVRIVVKAKGKHWGLVPKKEYTKDEAREIRIALLKVVFEFHAVVDTALEDLSEAIKHNEKSEK